jgi:phage shock protein A
MILDSLWRVIQAQLNKIASFFWTADPIAQMQHEYDHSVAQLKEGRIGLEHYQALVQRVGRQVANDQARVRILEASVKTYLQEGDRDAAAKFALQLQYARKDLQENSAQLQLHEQAYNNNLTKIQYAGTKLAEIRRKIAKYDAELKMSAAEAEMAKLAQDFQFDVTTDFGKLEGVIQDKISLNRAKVRVVADLSAEGVDAIRQEQAGEDELAQQALREFEAQMGRESPEEHLVNQQVNQKAPAKVQETTGS